MSCNCQTTLPVSPDGDRLPLLADECALAKGTTLCKQCPADESCLHADASDGTNLATSWTDACCYSEGVTLLGRVGTKLAKFAGSGYIALESGVAKVVESVPLRAVTLWHRWWKPTPASTPILGDPLPHPYLAVIDSNRNLHAIKGSTEDAVPHWDASAGEYTQKPVSEIELSRKGVIRSSSNIELVGFVPIADGGDPATVRPMKALSGEGLVILTEAVTVDDTCECAPGSGTASKASTLADPVPAGAETYTLKFSTALGKHWVED